MKQIITAKLKLVCNQEQKELLKQASLAYRDALNYVSQKAFELNKCSNGRILQKETYYELRDKFKLPSQMACNAPRQVAGSYKGLWTKAKQNAADLKSGRTKKRYKGLDKAPKYVSRTCILNYGRDYSFVKDKQVSVITLQGRIKIDYQGYDFHVHLVKSGAAKFGAAKLWYSKSSKQYYLLVSLELEIPELEPEQIKQIKGVDVGRRYLAVETDTNNKTKFYSGKSVGHKASRYQKARKSLQQKGTRSATKRLVAISGRERRFKADTNHCIAKSVVVPSSLIGLENLTHIREQTERRHNKKASKKQRRANRRQSTWAFAELHGFIDYKAVLAGSLAIKVDADYTSQCCPRCGHSSQENRPNKGLDFICKSCGFRLHADLIGARNITLRTLLLRQDFERTGCFSAIPNVSPDETKAERLQKYSELRWTVEAIPARECVGS